MSDNVTGVNGSGSATKSATIPRRVQRRRTRGWRMPENSVMVDRSTSYGNHWADYRLMGRAEAVRVFRAVLKANPHYVVWYRSALKGKNLACWCPLDEPCHADVLLEVANA